MKRGIKNKNWQPKSMCQSNKVDLIQKFKNKYIISMLLLRKGFYESFI